MTYEDYKNQMCVCGQWILTAVYAEDLEKALPVISKAAGDKFQATLSICHNLHTLGHWPGIVVHFAEKAETTRDDIITACRIMSVGFGRVGIGVASDSRLQQLANLEYTFQDAYEKKVMASLPEGVALES